jgi:hypothetical protein
MPLLLILSKGARFRLLLVEVSRNGISIDGKGISTNRVGRLIGGGSCFWWRFCKTALNTPPLIFD